MTAEHVRASASAGQPPGSGDLRLIVRDQPMSLAAHVAHYGPAPQYAAEPAALIAEVESAGLAGRGGGAFPTGRKLRAVAAGTSGRSSAVVVANGSESEPASSKDAVLLSHSPHLVLDGIALAAEAVGAARAYLCVGPRSGLARSVSAALAERDRAGLTTLPIEVISRPDGYLAGQETALVSALNGGLPVPTFIPPRPSDKGVRRQPTLVLNVETLAQVALIGRYGAAWFRSVGLDASPGSALVTVTGAVDRPGVREIPLGTALGEVLRRSGQNSPAQAVLTGGYFGTWVPLPAALSAAVSAPGLRAAGGSLGAGVLAVLPDTACGLAETARVTGYLASQIADQCGPCRNGMPALAEAMNWIAFGRPDADIIGWARQLTDLVTGRGACHLPDGAAGLVTSALEVFAADLRAHAQAGPCERAGRPAILPIPPGSYR
jgi:NADH:ubiquinone oxidoreductase subunit F (NADH-binding)